MAGKLDKKDYRVYVMVGDGETNEGQIWEQQQQLPIINLITSPHSLIGTFTNRWKY